MKALALTMVAVMGAWLAAVAMAAPTPIYLTDGDDFYHDSNKWHIIFALDGHDKVWARGGSDRIYGQRGYDHLRGGMGRD